MKLRSILYASVLLVTLLLSGFASGPVRARLQSDKEAEQAEPPPEEEQEEVDDVQGEDEELVEPDEPEEEQIQEEMAPPDEPPPPPPSSPPAPPIRQQPHPIPQQAAPTAPAQTPVAPAPSPAPLPVAAPQAAPTSAPKPAAPAPPATVSEPKKAAEGTAKLPAGLLKVKARLRSGPLAQDPTAVTLLDALESEQAKAADFNSIAVYLARKSFLEDAEGFAKVATQMDRTNRDYWLNYGTIRLQVGTLSSALVAYKKAKDLDPNHGLSWYSMGVVYDYMRRYDKAVAAYTTALALDPSLGDSKKNPQVINNERLMVVNLLLFQGKEGGLVMPLLGGPPLPEKPAPTNGKASKPR